MILFYSETCQHCSILLETIKRHDTKNSIKLVSVDSIINKIRHKVKAVPALMFVQTKEIIYGKAVFDYLLLPNRGYLFSSNSTREKQETASNPSIDIKQSSAAPPSETEPMAFTLGAVSSDYFSSIDDDNINSMNVKDDQVYKWCIIEDIEKKLDQPSSTLTTTGGASTKDTTSTKKLPSVDELQKLRENIFKDI
jgi:hypothetical protein